ncbi:MAG: hypothetical protein DWH88_01060 [Planctomycetota bacterium]|nr:MAG: hypothetical protein DWH88_01060 [Planctomycetota bacterium]
MNLVTGGRGGAGGATGAGFPGSALGVGGAGGVGGMTAFAERPGWSKTRATGSSRSLPAKVNSTVVPRLRPNGVKCER